MTGESLEAITDRLRTESPWADHITYEWLIQTWTWFVGEVERGYDDVIEEYENDLSSRELLQEVLDAAPPHLAAQLAEVLQPLDERFVAATEPLDPPLWPGGWWGERRPKRLVGELREDLEREAEDD